ncbi:hypothetical protein FACS189434_12880 [Bacteroidia bacterium]|nr:hypothetical protein FACS189434_12880 [Bacteroidia bacterium]
MKTVKKMKQLLLNKAFALIMGLIFAHIVCAQTTEKGLPVYDEYDDATALSDYLETSYCPHEISVWTSGGVSMLNDRSVSGKSNIGTGGAFGVGYTYFIGKKWGLSSGLEYAFYQSKISLNGFSDANANYDILNNPIIYNARIDNYSEKQFAGLLNIPLLVQYQTGGNHLFYAAAGLKFGLPVYGKHSGSNAILTASGYYPDYDQTEIWQNDLGYGVFNINENKAKLNLGVSLMGTLETGVKWNIGIGTDLYTGIFADYGLNNMLKGGYSNKSLVEYNHDESAKPIMNTACVLADKFAPLALGIKLKLAFSAGCRDLLNDRKAYKNMQSAVNQDDDFFDFETPVQTVDSIPVVSEINSAETSEAETPEDMQTQDTAAISVETPENTQISDIPKDNAETERQTYLEAAKERRQKYQQTMNNAAKTSGKNMSNYSKSIVTLNAQQKSVLDDYALMLWIRPHYSLEITGHTCDLGSDELNMQIGQERAELAKDYLVEQGVAPSRISTFSKGESEPLYPNTNEVNRKKNRRLEITTKK